MKDIFFEIKLRKKLSIATFFALSSALSLSTPASANYIVQHDFTWAILNGTPNLAGGVVTGTAIARPGGAPDSYNRSQISFGNPVAVNVSGSASSIGLSSAAFASSSANAIIFGRNITASTLAQGTAIAIRPPRPFFISTAFARSSAAVTASQIGINPFGQFTWKPLFWDYTSVGVSDFAIRFRDPISYTVTDPINGSILRKGNLLDISAAYDAGSVEWGAIGGVNGDPFTSAILDDQLDINFANNGSFKIDLTDSAVSNPGLLDIAAEGGLITRFNGTGRFAGLDGFKSVGDRADLSIPFSSIFPKELLLDYAFTGFNGGNPVNVDFNIGGDGNAAAEVPEPSSILGSLAALGFVVVSKRKLKVLKSD